MYASSLKLRYLFAALLVALAAATALHASINPAQKHMDGQACSSCHLSGDGINQENAHLLVAPQEELCAAACHPNSVQISHPSGIRPTLAIPPAYPLDWKGDMTCSTCHNVHGNTPGLMRGSARGRNLCLSCHDKGFFDKMADQGLSMNSSGHMSPATAKIDVGSLDIDPFTVQCMICHGDYTDKFGTTIDSKQILRHGSQSLSHPIGRRYSESLHKGRYKPESAVNQKLLLPDGRLSCVTCHRGYAKMHGKLRVTNHRSAICLECHNL